MVIKCTDKQDAEEERLHHTFETINSYHLVTG